MLALAATALLALPAGASAETQTYTETYGPVAVGGYKVAQSIQAPIPHPDVDGYITSMKAELVDEEGDEVPISRLMLHHIVFLNLAKQDSTCDSMLGWDSITSFAAPERFYAMGEERQRMTLPDGYGYRHEADDTWLMLFMVMNHKADLDRAYIRYEMTITDDPATKEVTPYWMDEANCQADPIYNVPGTAEAGSTHLASSEITVDEPGRLVAGGGHVHGGAESLSVKQPQCGNREVGASTPTWGFKGHPFYKVRPVLHEPGPIDMTAWRSEAGVPVPAGSSLRLESAYDNSSPHARVMAIMILYVAHDEDVGSACGDLPADTVESVPPPGRTSPVKYKIPLTSLDENGQAVTVSKPPGRTKRVASGATVKVGDSYFSKPNVSVRRGSRLNWRFDGSELHNVTLANGPVAIGSPNMNGNRVFTRRFQRSGTYKLFCALHPVKMIERVVVRPKRKRH